MQESSYIQEQRTLYLEKNEHMDKFFERVAPYEFYREIFPEGSFERKMCYEDGKGNGIALDIQPDGSVHRRILTDELDELSGLVGKEFVITSPVSYFGKSRIGRNARYLYALTFDLDGVDMPQLRDTIHQMSREIIPSATFIVNSGNGLHLYYVFDKPIPMYPGNQKFLKELKYDLTRIVWNRYTSKLKEPQVQGIFQGFRVVGTGTKLGIDYPVVAYRHGKRVSIEYLLGFISEFENRRQKLTGLLLRPKGQLTRAQAKEKYPEWYDRRVVRGEKKGRWVIKRDLYDWWLHRVEKEIRVGHRFYGIMTLAIYAMKCGIDEDELRRDAYRLLTIFDAMSYEETNRFTEDDVVSALEMYNESYVTFPRDDIAKYSGLPIQANRRNGRKQEIHLKFARATKEIMISIGEDVSGGRPSKEEVIREYMMEHPDETNKSRIAEVVGVHRNTVTKYYDDIRREIDRLHDSSFDDPDDDQYKLSDLLGLK